MCRSPWWLAVVAGAALFPFASADAEPTDRFGETLPPHAVARLESARLRGAGSARLNGAGMVWGVALSPDGKQLLAVVRGKPVRHWDPLTGDELPRPKHPLHAESQLGFSPDGKKIVASSGRQPITLHDSATGKLLVSLVKSETASSPLFAPDGKSVLALTNEGKVRIWDAVEGTVKQTHSVGESGPRCAAISPDGKTIALGCHDGKVRLFNLAEWKPAGVLDAHEHFVVGIVWSPHGKTLATTGNAQLRLWDAAGGKKLAEAGKVYAAGNPLFTPDGKRLIVCENGGVCLRDVSTGRELSRTRHFRSGGYSAALTPDGQTVAWGDQYPSIRLARILGDRLREVEPEHLLPRSLTFTRDGSEIITAGDGVVRFWDAAGGAERRRFPEERRAFTHLALSPDGETLALTSESGAVVLHDRTTGKQRRRWPTQGRAGAVALTPDGQRVAAADGNVVRLWDIKSGDEKTLYKGHTKNISDLTFSADGRTLVAGGEDGNVLFWDAASSAERGRLPRQDHPVSCVAVCCDGKTMATGDWEGHVRLWAFESVLGEGKPRTLPQPPAHDDNVSAVLFSPDGRLLATAGWDGQVHLWDVKRGRMYRELKGHSDEVCSLAFARDGKRLASGSRDHTVLIWVVDDE